MPGAFAMESPDVTLRFTDAEVNLGGSLERHDNVTNEHPLA
jgi:hypothetical protein